MTTFSFRPVIALTALAAGEAEDDAAMEARRDRTRRPCAAGPDDDTQ